MADHPITTDEDGNVVGQLPMFMTASEILQSHAIRIPADQESDEIVLGVKATVAKPEIVVGTGMVLDAFEQNPDILLPVTFE